jgi:agmatine deiminase
VRFFANNTFQRLGTSPTVAVQPPPPASVTVNGSSVALTVAAGASVTVAVTNGPGNPTDFLALNATGAADNAYLDWFWLNGTKTAPVAGLTTASVSFSLPSTPGTYEVRFFANNTFQRLGTSPTVTVK